MTTSLEDIRFWPTSPGVYLMRDAKECVLYVGKAKNLRERIGNYLRGQDTRYQVAFLMKRVASLDYIVAGTEKEALLLEYTLIQKYKPKYNVFLKDDKSFVQIRLTESHPFPGIYTTRRVEKDGARYFGPYTSANACRETVEAIIRQCQIRSCTDREFANRARPCIQYQIGRCTAPCVNYISREKYAEQVHQAVLLLEGRTSEVRTELKAAMARASEEMHYEEAARLRDRLTAIDTTVEAQNVVKGEVDEDWVGWASHEDKAVVSLLKVRCGRVEDRPVAIETLDPDEGPVVVAKFLVQYYQAPAVPPPRIYWPFEVEPPSDLLAFLEERRGSHVDILFPRKRAERLHMAEANAESVLASSGEGKLDLGLRAIQKSLHLPSYPQHMECVDISNWQGEQASGAVVVFRDGKPSKSEYRHYNIKGVEAAPSATHFKNDYAMMVETLSRRFAKYPVPNLLLVDGGKGQLQMALRVCEELRLPAFPIAAIAKGRGKGPDKIYLPMRKNPLPLRADNIALLLLQRMRDAAHRFGVSFVRHKMRKARVRKTPK